MLINGTEMKGDSILFWNNIVAHVPYRNTMPGSPPGEWIFIYFWKNKVRLSKIEFLNMCFFSKKKK